MTARLGRDKTELVSGRRFQPSVRNLWIVFILTTLFVLIANWASLGEVVQPCTRVRSIGVFEYTPNCVSNPEGVRYRINSHGIAVGGFEELASATGADILYLGWTEPFPLNLIPPQRRLPHFLERAINDRSPSASRIRVIDGSEPGVNGGFSLERAATLIRDFHPKTVIYFFVPNGDHLREAVGFGVTSWLSLQLEFVKLSWSARMFGTTANWSLGPSLSTVRKLGEIAKTAGSRFIVFWPTVGLQPAYWSQRFPPTAEGLIAKLLGALVAPVKITSEQVAHEMRDQGLDFVEIRGGWPQFQANQPQSGIRQIRFSRVTAGQVSEILMVNNRGDGQ